MATLNTLRTRFGFVLTGVIALVLLAFIFSPSDLINFSGNDPVVAKINGQNVTYSEYAREYDNVQRQSGVTAVDEEQANMLYQSTWQSLVSNHIVTPGLDEMGLVFGKSEYAAVLRGMIPTQTMYSAFGNPQTGAYDLAAVNNFVNSSRGNAEAEAMWALLVDQLEEERITTKYLALVAAGINVNSLEAKLSADGNNKSFAGNWASKRYTDVDDSEVSVSDAEVKNLYESRKETFKRDPSRTISYVLFSIDPTTEDLSVIETKAKGLAEQFADVEISNIPSFVRESRSGSVATTYVPAEQLPTAESAALVAGEMYGPSISADGSAWRISRVVESVFASDTLSVRHIVLPYTSEALADSLLVALQAGGDFAEAAMTYSQYQESAQNGGDVGPLVFSMFEDAFAEALAPARKGDVVKVATGDMIQLLQVYDATPRKKHYKIASINIPIVPSQATRTAVHSAAGQFAINLSGNSANLATVASEASVSPFEATLVPSSRFIDAVDGSVDVARWAHKAAIGDVSEIFSVEDGYLVGVVTAINNDKYESLESASTQLKSELINKKKFELLKSKLSGSSFESQVSALEDAATGEFSNVNYDSYYIPGLGVESTLIGSIISTDSPSSSAPIEGQYGMYIFEVTNIDSEGSATVDSEKARMEAMAQQSAQQILFSALASMGDIVDLRGSVL